MTPEPAQPAESPEARAREVLAIECEKVGALASARAVRNGNTIEGFFVPAYVVVDAMLAFAATTARPTERGHTATDDMLTAGAEAAMRSANTRASSNPKRFVEEIWTAMQAARPTERGAVEEGNVGEGFKFSEAVWADAVRETNRLCYELDITNADHIVLWLEHQLDGIKGPLAYIACRILEAHEALATQPATGRTMGGEVLARRFHETYERLAPSFGYETRAETREFDPSSPNGRLMIAVCTALQEPHP